MDAYDQIAAYYDCEHDAFRDDIELYLNLLDRGPVLEIGAGTGRIAEPLLRAGLEVWAVDSSASMLRRARARLHDLPGAHIICADIANLNLPQAFPAALLPLNTLWHIASREGQVGALRTVARHLESGGILVIDLVSPLTMLERGGAGELRQVYRGQCGSETLTRTVAAWDDEAEQILELAVTYHVAGDQLLREVTSAMTLRYLYRSEVELMLELAGLIPRQVYGSYDLDPYDRESERLVVVAQKP